MLSGCIQSCSVSHYYNIYRGMFQSGHVTNVLGGEGIGLIVCSYCQYDITAVHVCCGVPIVCPNCGRFPLVLGGNQPQVQQQPQISQLGLHQSGKKNNPFYSKPWIESW